MAKLSAAGKLWEEADFECMKIDEYCSDLLQALDKDNTDIQQKRILGNWKDSCEKKKLTPLEILFSLSNLGRSMLA